MNKRDQALEIATQLLDDIELQRLRPSEIILKASRIARLTGNDELREFTTCEREGYEGHEERWIKFSGREMTMPEKEVFISSISKIEASTRAVQEVLDVLKSTTSFDGEMALLTHREHNQSIIHHANILQKYLIISNQVVAAVYRLVEKLYYELIFSQLQETLFVEAQSAIDGALTTASGTALSKMEQVSERLRNRDPEAVSHALTTCRRLIDSCADYVFPPRAEPYVTRTGSSIEVGAQQVLNRLNAYIDSQEKSAGRRDRLRRSLKDLYSRCSAGTHAEVAHQEARFVFLQTYVVLGEILTMEVDRNDEPVQYV